MNRWLYHGLHSLDFPWLYNYRPLWDIVVITFMVGGTALCVTSLVLAWRVLGRTLGRAAIPGAAGSHSELGDDLAIEIRLVKTMPQRRSPLSVERLKADMGKMRGLLSGCAIALLGRSQKSAPHGKHPGSPLGPPPMNRRASRRRRRQAGTIVVIARTVPPMLKPDHHDVPERARK